MPLSPDLLRVSKSTAHQLSLTVAAEESGTTQPAVSQQIKRLEKELATPLFQRAHRSIVLTGAGQLLLRHVITDLGTIDAGVAALGAHQCHEVLQVVTNCAFVTYWLMPCPPRFHQAHPHLDVNLVTSERDLTGQHGGINVAILFDGGRSKHDEAHRLFREGIFPVCSPRLVEELQLPLAKAHLARLPVLHLKPV